MLFPGKGFDRAHACKVFLGDRIERRVLLADILVHRTQLALHDNGYGAA